MVPTKLVKNLLPTYLNWIKEVVDIEHSGTVRKYVGSGVISTPDQEWEEYEITIKIDYSKLRNRRSCENPTRWSIVGLYSLENLIGYHQTVCLGSTMHEINLLFGLDYKYEFKIVDSNLQDRPF